MTEGAWPQASSFLHCVATGNRQFKHRMVDKQEIINLVNEAVAQTDAFVVDVNVSPSNEVTVELDAPTGVDLDFCAALTRKINDSLPEDEDFSLEVGSSSLTAPFKVRQQYDKHLGDQVEVLTRDGRKLKGVLAAAGDDTFTIEVPRKVKEPGQKRPTMVNEPETFSYADVKSTTYVIDFK